MNIKKGSDDLSTSSLANCYPVKISCISSTSVPQDLFFSAVFCKYLNVHDDANIEIIKTNENIESVCKTTYLKNEDINLVRCIFLDKREFVGEDLSVARAMSRFFYLSKFNIQKNIKEKFFGFLSNPLIFGNIEHWVSFATDLLSLSVATSKISSDKEERENKINELQSKVKVLCEYLENRDFLIHIKEVSFADLIMYSTLKRVMLSNLWRDIFEKRNQIGNFLNNVEKTLSATKMSSASNCSCAEKEAGRKKPMTDAKQKVEDEKNAQQEAVLKSRENKKEVDGNDDKNINFLRQIVEEDLRTGKHTQIITRFPPEPNGYLHLGHAKSIILNFGLAQEFNGTCNLRFDDTNPTKEEHRYIEAIKEDIKWLGFDWKDNLFYASDYFDQLYEWAVLLIKKELAYVDDQTIEEIKENRGTITIPGKLSPYRNRSVEMNLDLFNRMRLGEFEEGSRVLRLKIDMSSPNMNLRDPIIYRILKRTHPRTKDLWCIYPMYDFAHGQSDSIERITHSICTLEFELHRPLYEFIQDKLGIHKTRQIEFARLNCTYMVMSKRKLLVLVEEGYVEGWDDPRMPTLSGMRRRGIPPEVIYNFCKKIGVARRPNNIKIELLECCIRDYMNKESIRCTAILNPLKVVITNFEEESPAEHLLLVRSNKIAKNDIYSSMTSKSVWFGRELYIDADDFSEDPPSDFHRLSLGKEVRLNSSYVIKCNEVVKDDHGKIIELKCTYNPDTKEGKVASGNNQVKGVIHWLHANHAKEAEIRMYDRLFTKSNPEEKEEFGKDFDSNDVKVESNNDWKKFINPNSLRVYNGLVEEDLVKAKEIRREKNSQELYLQFERIGYFVLDRKSLKDRNLVFNLCVGLVDTYRNEELSKAKQEYKIARQKAEANRKMKKTARMNNKAKSEADPKENKSINQNKDSEDDAKI